METLSYYQMMERMLAAEARVVELTAENVALKATNDDRRIFIMNGVQLGYIKVPTVETDPALETIRIAVSPQEPNPATDAYLAGVKADGVKEFIGRLQQCVDDGDFVGDEVAVIVGAIDCGKEFCEQLRESVK